MLLQRNFKVWKNLIKIMLSGVIVTWAILTLRVYDKFKKLLNWQQKKDVTENKIIILRR